MAYTNGLGGKKNEILCPKCNGRMAFEKFYGESDSYFAWRCVICGDILDPVILLHRLSRKADLRIPEKEEDRMALVEKYLKANPRGMAAR